MMPAAIFFGRKYKLTRPPKESSNKAHIVMSNGQSPVLDFYR